MIKKFLSIVMMLTAMMTLSSCLNSDEEDVTYYDDTAITAFSLGTLKRYHTTTAKDGSDSTYTTSLTGSSYKFYIDQLNRRIYNPDSLPVGVDAKHVLCTITTKNSGTPVLVLRSQAGTDSLAYYSSSDSIDFSNPVRIRVFSNSGKASREYTVSVNIHQQTGDELSWSHDSIADLTAMGARHLVAMGGNVYLFGLEGDKTVAYKNNGSAWQRLDGVSASATAYNNVIAKGSYLYMLDGTTLQRSTDGNTWETVATPAITRLLGASATKLYALTTTGLAASTDGITWTDEALDTDVASLPMSNFNFACRPSVTNDNTYQLFLIGTNNGETKVWSKVEENGSNVQNQPWFFYPADEYNKKTLPAMDNLRVIRYGNGLLALGGDYSTFYYSADDGLTWAADSSYALPDAFGKTTSMAPFAMAANSQSVIYLTVPGSSLIWHGRLARMGWANNQTSFTK